MQICRCGHVTNNDAFEIMGFQVSENKSSPKHQMPTLRSIDFGRQTVLSSFLKKVGILLLELAHTSGSALVRSCSSHQKSTRSSTQADMSIIVPIGLSRGLERGEGLDYHTRRAQVDDPSMRAAVLLVLLLFHRHSLEPPGKLMRPFFLELRDLGLTLPFISEKDFLGNGVVAGL